MPNLRFREDFNEDGTESSVYTIQSGSSVYSFLVKGNRCTCSKSQFKFEKQCITTSSNPQQVSLLGREVYKMDTITEIFAYSMWAMKDPLKREGICWPMSIFSTGPGMSVESVFYDMSDIVDASVFVLPNNCPSTC